MKVLQILPELNAGGVERGTVELARFLVSRGHEALVISNGGQLIPELESAGARHLALPVHRKSLKSLFQVRPLRQLLARERPDILHIRSRVPGWIAWLAWRRTNPQTRPHFVSTVHGFYSVNAYSAVMTKGERVIAVSDCVRDYIRQNYPNTAPDRIRVIPRGIEPTLYFPKYQPDAVWREQWERAFPQFIGRRLLTLPGRITRLKGHEDFLRLLAALAATDPAVHGVVVGGAHPRKQDYLQEIQNLVHQLGIADRVTFVGHRSDLREILAVSDLVFSLSTQPEAFGRTTLEALALGRPAIGYQHGGVGELLQKFLPAGLVPLGDAAALRQTTQRMLTEPATPAPITNDYRLTAMCEQTLEVYHQLATPPTT
jgi:glycosyltransferase involved in cell wall biosynthesis